MRLRAAAGLLVLCGVLAGGCGPVSGDSASPGAPAAPTARPPASATPGAPASATPTARPPASATPGQSATGSTPGAPASALRPGSSGPAVLALQRRLVELGYWLGTPDGRYGSATAHAVTAFQKASGLDRDGVAGKVTLGALRRATRPAARSASGRVVEVDLRHQLLLLVVDGRVAWVLDTSTGAVAGTTPRGHYRVSWAVDGYHRSPLGVLYRPRYFVGGVAVHGFPSVPPYPASHGCVRVTNQVMDWLWATNALPIGGAVWVY